MSVERKRLQQRYGQNVQKKQTVSTLERLEKLIFVNAFLLLFCQEGSYICSCKDGFVAKVEWNGETCVDIDECAQNTHDCSADSVCLNLAGNFTCDPISDKNLTN